MGAACAAAVLAAGCGEGSGDQGTVTGDRPAPEASAFPAAKGKTLDDVLNQVGSVDLAVLPAGLVFRPGPNPAGFGVFTLSQEQVTDADIALYASRGPDEEVIGPFPAHHYSLETDPQFAARTTFDDPSSALSVYRANIEFPAEGNWSLAAVVDQGGELGATRVGNARVGDYAQIPDVGDKAPVIHTPTAEDVGGDLEEIDTRVPASTMHEHDFADVVGKQPVVLLFATPALCQSRVCGPVVDVAEQVKAETSDEVVFIHQEIFIDNQPEKGLRPQVEEYGLATEPWLFVIDEAGRVSTAIEGAFGLTELREAVDEVEPE